MFKEAGGQERAHACDVDIAGNVCVRQLIEPRSAAAPGAAPAFFPTAN
jgi:hypothetical protein